MCISAVEALSYSDLKDIILNFWTDLSTVMDWIQNQEAWLVFLRNRVKEIRNLKTPKCWRHVPGTFNPAVLPSRGCIIHQLIASRLWEGPSCLKDNSTSWPSSEYTLDLKSISEEKIKKEITSASYFSNQTSACH